ncbi:MAG: cyclase family protein [Actinobacteria bacterium]|nr:cyclase family protein [Actinomycetota bacterium]
MTDYRARFDAEVTFTNGGSMTVSGFLIDVPSATTTSDEIGRRFVESLGLLMTGEVRVSAVEIVREPHRGTRAERSEASAPDDPFEIVDLNHVITAGMTTYPGLPAPTITPHLTREQSRSIYAPGTEFAMDVITLIGNTGTYLDSPFHRYAGQPDLADLRLAGLVRLPAVVVRIAGSATRGVDDLILSAIGDVAGHAVLIHSGDSERFGTPAYAEDAAYLSRSGAEWLVARGAALVGIDSVNIDAVPDTTRPAHSVLLDAGIPIVEHMTGLDRLPIRGARFSAVPPRVRDFGTFPVRAFAEVPHI